MAKAARKTYPINKLSVRYDVNGREQDNYDLPSMMQQIKDAGRIIQPIIVERMGEDIVVLAGNRRTLSGQKLYEDVTISTALHEALSKVDVLEYSDLSEKERYEFIYDQGSQKPLSRTEVVKAVWRLSKQFFTEAEVINLLYFQLAKYTGNERKLREVPIEPKAREQFLKKWFHGTVGNYILAAERMGDYPREQMILTHRAEDGLLTEGEKVEVRMSRDRVVKLSAAKSEDKMDWSYEKGGPKFNELLETFKKEDAGVITEEKKKRPSVKDLTDRASSFKTPALRKILLIAAGESGDNTKGIVEDDDNLYRERLVLDTLVKEFDRLKEPYKAFVKHLLDDKPADFEMFLKSL